jgi:hypothetical protein
VDNEDVPVVVRRGKQHEHGIVDLVNGEEDDEPEMTINTKRSASKAFNSDDEDEVVELEVLTDEQKSAFEAKRLKYSKLNRTPGAKELLRGQLLVQEDMAEGVMTPFHTTVTVSKSKAKADTPFIENEAEDVSEDEHDGSDTGSDRDSVNPVNAFRHSPTQSRSATSVDPRSPAPAAAKVAAAQAPSASSVAPRSPAPTAQAAVAASTPTAAVAFDATAYAGEAEQALAASPPLVASPSVVGLIANFLRIVNGLGDPLACIIWGSTFGHMAHLTAAKAKSVNPDKAARVLEEDSANRGLAAADTLTVELDAPYMGINGTKPVYFTGKLTATTMGKTMGELEAELLAVYANNFDRSNTRPRRVTVVFAKDFVLTTKNQVDAWAALCRFALPPVPAAVA